MSLFPVSSLNFSSNNQFEQSYDENEPTSNQIPMNDQIDPEENSLLDEVMNNDSGGSVEDLVQTFNEEIDRPSDPDPAVMTISTLTTDLEPLSSEIALYQYLFETSSYQYYDTYQSVNGELSVELPEGSYIVNSKMINSQNSSEIYLKYGQTKSVDFIFSKIELNGYSLHDYSKIVDISVYDGSSNLVSELYNFNQGEKQTLYLNPAIYQLKFDDRTISIDATFSREIPVLLPENNQVNSINGISLSNTASFGELAVNITSVNGMPLRGIQVEVFNSTSGLELFQGNTNSTGLFSNNVNPTTYDLRITPVGSFLPIWIDDITVSGGQITFVDYQLSTLIYYTDIDENVYLTNPSDTLTYTSIRSYSNQRVKFFIPLNTSLRIETNGYMNVYSDINSTVVERIELNDRIEFSPEFIDIQTQGRINANESTDISIKFTDFNYDYPLTLQFKPLHGSVVTRDITWTYQNSYSLNPVLGTTVTFNAPTYNDFYQLDFSVIDQSDRFDNYTLYLSDNYSDVTFNATGANDRALDMNIRSTISETASNIVQTRTYSDGVVTVSLVDGYYDFTWYQTLNHLDYFIKIDANVGTYYFNYSFAEIQINTTMHYGNPFGASVMLHNSTTGAQLVSSSTSTSTGLKTFIVPEGTDYSIRTYEYTGNEIWDNDFTAASGVLTPIDHEYGLLSVYVFDGETPLNREVRLYNGTDGSTVVFMNTYGDGIANLILAPYFNYTAEIMRTPSEFHYNNTVEASKATAIGDFVNSKPVISSISASPSRINANESTIISVSASDADSVDFLEYSWVSNVGSISGTGSSINYSAPIYDTYYRIDVNVSDQFGGWINTFIVVSNRVSSVNVTVSGAGNRPLDTTVNIQSQRPNTTSSTWSTNSRTYSDGYITFTNILDDEYRIYVSLTNTIEQYHRVNETFLNVFIQFGEILVNSTSYQGAGLSSGLEINYNETGQQIIRTTTPIDGLYRTYLHPGNYDFLSDKYFSQLTEYNTSIAAGEEKIIDFEYGEILVNMTTAFGNPRDVSPKLYRDNSTSGQYLISSRTNSDGLTVFYIAPGLNYSVLFDVSYPDYEAFNLTAGPNERRIVGFQEGMVSFYQFNGETPENVQWRITYPNQSSNIASGSTGTDGFHRISLTPGIYDFYLDGVLYEDVEVLASENIEIGIRYNFSPNIQGVSDSGKIGPDETTTVTLDVWDTNYDFPSLYVDVATNVGSVTYDIQHLFISQNEYRISFNYTSSSILETYMLNITLHDGFGANDSYYYFLSEIANDVVLKSVKANNLPESTSVAIYDQQTGATVYSSTTDSTTGKRSTTVSDGYYNIRFSEFNQIWFRNVWIMNGQSYNITAEFGEVDIFATGVGGVPIDAFVYIYNQTDNTYLGNVRTYSDGFVNVILAPSSYKFVVDQATDIILFGDVIGGQSIVLGSEVPNLNNNPELLTYFFGETNQSITWDFSDNNPLSYNVTLDGALWDEGSWDGSDITVDFTGLAIGTYDVRINVYDGYDYYNYDTATIQVISPAAPQVSDLKDRTLQFNGSTILEWEVTSIIGDNYTILLNHSVYSDGLWENGTIVAFINNYLEGYYNFTIIIEDELGRIASDIVIITVGEDPLPELSISPDTSVEFGFTGIDVNYTITDNNIDLYEIWINEILVDSDNAVVGDFIYTLTKLPSGTHNITISIIDMSGQRTTKMFELTVLPDPVPTITIDPDFEIYLSENDVLVNFTLSDNNPNNYEIYLNGSLIYTVLAINGDFDYQLMNLPLGSNNLTIVLYDGSAQSGVGSTIIVVIDDINPEITSSNDQTIIVGEEVEPLSFAIVDVSRVSSELYLDGEMIEQFGNENLIDYTFTGSLSEGVYNFTLLVTDSEGNTNIGSIFVTVEIDKLQFIDAPEDQVLSPTQLVNTKFNWTAYSTQASSYDILINGTVISSGQWVANTSNIFSITGYSTGNLLEITIRINNTVGMTEIHDFNILLVSEEVGNFLDELSTLELSVIVVIMMAILIGIFRKGGRGNVYGRVF